MDEPAQSLPPLKKGGRGDFDPWAGTHDVQIPPYPPLLKEPMIQNLSRMAAVFEPLLIRAIWWKEIMAPLHLQTRRSENLEKTLTEITLGEIDAVQAARS